MEKIKKVEDFLIAAKELQLLDKKNKNKVVVRDTLAKMEEFSIRELIAIASRGVNENWSNENYQKAKCNKNILDLLVRKFKHF